jgi:YfiH family protein
MARVMRHPLLAARGVEHGFGLRDGSPPQDVVRVRQVHGAEVATVEGGACASPARADAVVSSRPGVRVGVATADCVPVLLSAPGGAAVAAIHAGWRGLAAGVIAAGVRVLGRFSGESAELVAAIGPHIGPCCYEVDRPVIELLSARFAAELEAALHPARPGHAMLDLGALTAAALVAEGLAPAAVGRLPQACTCCDSERFHSYRRDGARAGRLIHFIAARSAKA